jgi:hypothetical protein
MFAIVIVTCLSTDPQICNERIIAWNNAETTCLETSQQVAANWSQENVGQIVASWRCVKARHYAVSN